jgi:hypothetical protein
MQIIKIKKEIKSLKNVLKVQSEEFAPLDNDDIIRIKKRIKYLKDYLKLFDYGMK